MEKKKTGPAKGDPRCVEGGRRGGKAVVETYGREFYQGIGKRGGKALRETYGIEHFRDIGKKGAQAKKARKAAKEMG